MALGGTTIVEVQTGGSDSANGGCFDPGKVSAGGFTDGAATSATGNSPVFSSASYNFVAGDVGAWLYIDSGTNWTPGWYQIASVASNVATLTATIGTALLSSSNRPTGLNTVAGCATTASPTGAKWSIDYSQQAAAQFSYTDLASAGAGLTVSSAATPFNKQMVGNGLYIASGTNFTSGYYVIASVDGSNIATVVGAANITTGAGASGVGGLGGALASPGRLGFLLNAAGVANMLCFIKSGTYGLSTTTVNVSGGPIDTNTGMQGKNLLIKGYQNTRQDYTGTRPVIDANGNAPTNMLNMGGTSSGSHSFYNLSVDGESRNVNGITGSSATYNTIYNCYVFDCDGTYGFSGARCIFCKVYSCAASGFGNFGTAIYCWADACETGFSNFSGIRCVSSNNSVDGYNGYGMTALGCVSYNNTGDGFESSTTGRVNSYMDCISFSDAGYGWKPFSLGEMINCAYGADGAGSGRINTVPFVDQNPITLTANPFTNAAGGDFSLNNTAGGGALLRALGFSPYGQTGYLDIGAVQHQDTPPIVISRRGGLNLSL